MISRARVRVGKQVLYYPSAAEASTGNGLPGDAWAATITRVNADGSVNLSVHEADGGFIAKTSVPKGSGTGVYSVV